MFFNARKKKLRRPGQSGDVMITYLPPFLLWVVEMVAYNDVIITSPY